MPAAEKDGKNAGKDARKQATEKQTAEKQATEKQTAGQENPLPPEMTAALAAFERHLRAERSLSPHTVRAYLGDVSSLLNHAHRAGVQAPEGLDATHLPCCLPSHHAPRASPPTFALRSLAPR